jgi:hypothetical protein
MALKQRTPTANQHRAEANRRAHLEKGEESSPFSDSLKGEDLSVQRVKKTIEKGEDFAGAIKKEPFTEPCTTEEQLARIAGRRPAQPEPPWQAERAPTRRANLQLIGGRNRSAGAPNEELADEIRDRIKRARLHHIHGTELDERTIGVMCRSLDLLNVPQIKAVLEVLEEKCRFYARRGGADTWGLIVRVLQDEAATQQRCHRPATEPNSQKETEGNVDHDELRGYLNKTAAAYLGNPATQEVAASLQAIANDLAEQAKNLEHLERRLKNLEDKAVGILRAAQNDADLYAIRAALDKELKPYRGKMSAEQISMLERRYLDTAILERARLPRLSLFYMDRRMAS